MTEEKRTRVLPEAMLSHTHYGMRMCVTMDSVSISTLDFEERDAAVCVAVAQKDRQIGAVFVIEEEHIPAIVTLLLNAAADAKRIKEGKKPFAAPADEQQTSH